MSDKKTPSERAGGTGPITGADIPRALWAFWAAAILLTAAGAWLRFSHLPLASIEHDSVFDLHAASGSFEEVTAFVTSRNTGFAPLAVYLMWGSMQIFGQTPLGACFISALSFSLMIPAVIALGAVSGSRLAGLLGALLLVAEPGTLRWAHECRWWGPLPFLGVLVALLSLTLIQRPRAWKAAVLSLLCPLIFFTHPYAGFISLGVWPAALGMAVWRHRWRLWRDLPLWVLTLAPLVSGLLFVGFLLWARTRGGEVTDLRPFTQQYDWGWIKRVAGEFFLASPMLHVGLAAAGVLTAVILSPAAGWTLAFALAALPLIIARVNDTLDHALFSRHLVPLIPFWALAIGMGIAGPVALLRSLLRRWAGPRSALLASSLALGGAVALLGWLIIRPQIERLPEFYEQETWGERLLNRLEELATPEHNILLLDFINWGEETHGALSVFDRRFSHYQMFPGLYFIQNAGFRPSGRWDSTLFVTRHSRELGVERLHVLERITETTLISEARPPLSGSDDFAEVTAEVLRALLRDNRMPMDRRSLESIVQTLEAPLRRIRETDPPRPEDLARLRDAPAPGDSSERLLQAAREAFVSARHHEVWSIARDTLRGHGMSVADALEAERPPLGSWIDASHWLRDHVGSPEETLEVTERALEIAGDHAEIQLVRGDMLLRLGRHEEALAASRQALALQPGHPWGLIFEGDALRGLGREEEAQASWRRVLELPSGQSAAEFAEQRIQSDPP